MNNNVVYQYALNLSRCGCFDTDLDNNDDDKAINDLHQSLKSILSESEWTKEEDDEGKATTRMTDGTITKRFQLFWPKLRDIDEDLEKHLVLRHQMPKHGGGNQQASAATVQQKSNNNNTYNQLEIYNLATEGASGQAVHFWVVREQSLVVNGDDVDDYDSNDDSDDDDCEEIPTHINGHSCFNISVSTLKEAFKGRNHTPAKVQSAMTGGITSQMKQPVPPSGVVFSILQNSKRLNTFHGIWKLCEVSLPGVDDSDS
jgi:hypothetical protein